VLRSQIRGKIRRTKRKQFASARGGQGTGPEPSAEQQERIAATLDILPDRQEAVLRAKYLDSQSVAEIAAQWNETPKAIESLLNRARQAFREAYRGEGD